MSFIPHQRVSDMLDNPNYEHDDIKAMAAAADEFDQRTGTNQYERDSEFLQVTIRRRDMTLDLLVGSWMAEDKLRYEEEIARLDALIERESRRLGL